MLSHRNSRYPYHLAKLVAQRLADSGIEVADETLLRLFEVMYFASLKTDEARPCRCTLNYIDPDGGGPWSESREHDGGWTVTPFRTRLRLDVRSLLKLSDAADPTVSSLAVHCNEEGELFVWGMVDQELRYGDFVSLDATGDPRRPGLFQATITGVGCVSVYKDFALLGSLDQNNLVDQYHDVLWDGPVHKRLKQNLESTLLDERSLGDGARALAHVAQVKNELLVRWQNAICRVLFNIQQYGHGGGLLIVPEYPTSELNVKYESTYNRLPRALFRLAQHQILKRQTADTIASHCRNPEDVLPCGVHFNALRYHQELERLKNELRGCVRFIASLSRVDGFVLLDRSLIVHGFGVEARANTDVTDVHIAGDAKGSVASLRVSPISQFGTRHRAMMRFCDENDGALGFVISQDGDIRATMKHNGRLVLWENINVQLAYRAENRGGLIPNFSQQTMNGLFHYWMHSVANLRSA